MDLHKAQGLKVFISKLIEKEKSLPEHITASVISFRILYHGIEKHIHENPR